MDDLKEVEVLRGLTEQSEEEESDGWKLFKNRQRIARQSVAAMELIASGQITISEAARLIGTSRQRVHKWTRGYDDIAGARERLLRKLWAKAIAPIERKFKRKEKSK
jgi:DNA-binding transcriptional regulator YiaG